MISIESGEPAEARYLKSWNGGGLKICTFLGEFKLYVQWNGTRLNAPIWMKVLMQLGFSKDIC